MFLRRVPTIGSNALGVNSDLIVSSPSMILKSKKLLSVCNLNNIFGNFIVSSLTACLEIIQYKLNF